MSHQIFMLNVTIDMLN